MLGGLLYPAGTVDSSKIPFINSGGSLSVSIASSSYAAGNFYTNFVQETRGGSTLTLPTSSVPNRSSGKICPLYTGYTATPALIDTDGDGIPDAWEIIQGLNPLNAADAALDADGDGQTNLAEYLAGTDPRAANGAFRIEQISAASNTLTLTFTARADRTYTVQYSDTLAANGWLKLTDIPASAERAVSVNTTMSTPRRFYRIVTPPTP